MGFVKYMSTKEVKVLDEEENVHISKGLRRMGKTSLTELTEAERSELTKGLNSE